MEVSSRLAKKQRLRKIKIKKKSKQDDKNPAYGGRGL
jgi:hypothetical protein